MKKTKILSRKFRTPYWFIRPSQAITSLIFFLIVAVMDLIIEKNIEKFLFILFIGWGFVMGMMMIINFMME